MVDRRRHPVQLGIALVLSVCCPACWLLPPDPATTLDAKESPELLARASGTVVVADGASRLLLVSLPEGRTEEFTTEGKAIVASPMDAQGRVVYMRESDPIITDKRYTLVLKSLVSGKEHRVFELVRGRERRANEFAVDLAEGRAMCSLEGRVPHVFDIETGRELDLPWAERVFAALRLSGDGKSVIGWESEKWLAIDVATGTRTVLASHQPFGFDLEGSVAGTAGEPWELPGRELLPCTFIGDDLAVYVGLASPASKPRGHWTLSSPSDDRSIRLGDVVRNETVTLVPRFFLGSYAYSRFAWPVAPSR